jgi:hypothetical protein
VIVNRVWRFLLRVILLPITILRLIGRFLGGMVGTLFGPAVRRIDASERLSVLINSLSSAMATQRGLPILAGTALLVTSLVAHAVVLVILVASDGFDARLYLLCIPFTLLHLGVLVGFTGTMLAIPLGQGYKDK